VLINKRFLDKVREGLLTTVIYFVFTGVETINNKLFMRGRTEMNIIKQIASRGLIYVLAVAILGTGFLMSSDSIVQAEKLGTVALTNKATAKTTEASPASSLTAPSSRTNASTVYVTMTDVTTANAVKNSHLIDANKVVITVAEADFNTKVATRSAVNNVADATATHQTGMTPVAQGLAGSPVIDSDGDGDLTDEISVKDCANGQTPAWSGTAWSGTCTVSTAVWQIVAVANGNSATVAATSPMVTIISNTATGGGDAGAGTLADGDDLFIGYYSSAVNTFTVTAWSTVQLQANASVISVVETGRNTGIFEAEFLVADTEGVNDNTALTTLTGITASGTDQANTFTCGASGAQAAVTGTTPADGRWDAHGGVNADCEYVTLSEGHDTSMAILVGTPAAIPVVTLPAGDFILDDDADGSILDSFTFGTDGEGNDFVAGNVGQLTTVTIATCTLVADCGVAHTAARDMTLTLSVPVAVVENTSDIVNVGAMIGNNIVDNEKVDTGANDTVTSADLKSGRVGSDTISTGSGAPTQGLTRPFITGIDRTPIVEAQANSTITVQYQDLTDSSATTSATTGTKVKATVTVDASAPSATVSSPTAGSSFKDRQPTFTGTASDIGSGLDVSTATLYVDMLNDTASTGITDVITTTNLAGAWLGGAGTINLQDRYDAMAVTLDNTTTMVDGITSITWTVATSANIPCTSGTADGIAEASIVNTGASTHTNFAGAVSCNVALATPDVVVDYMISATDLAGNRGFSDAKADTDTVAVGDPYTFNIDELKPTIDSANTETGVYYNAGTYAEKTGALDKIVVAFDDEISTADATAFQVTLDAGTVLTPLSVEVGTNGTNASGVAYDFRKNVYLTLPSNMTSADTPKVKLVGDVADLAGNSTKSGTVAGAIDKVKPTISVVVSGGSGTGTGSDASDKLTKSAMTMTITTSEVLSTPPTVSIFAQDYGTTGVYEVISASSDLDELAAATAKAITITPKTVIDTDKDGSLTDEIVLAAGDTNPIPAAQLINIAITSVVNSGEGVIVTVTNNNSAALTNNADQIKISGNQNAAASATTTTTSAEGTVSAVAQDSLTYTATFSGSSFSDIAAKDGKAIIVSGTDASTAPNTGTSGSRDQSSASAHTFRLDKTTPVLITDPDGDATVGSTTTLPRPYVIIEFTDNSTVTVVSASFGGDDILAQLATTNSKKYFMVPTADLTAKTYAVKAKATDLAGNKGAEGSYNLKVTSRADFKTTILAGWNLMSFPSDPVSNGVANVFTNAGIDQVVGYDAMAKSSPWTVATKDAASGTYSGGLASISSGNGYWIHSTEFSSQAVSLTGPEGPSASAPPSIGSIDLASGWNLIGVTDATKAKTQANEGTLYKTNASYLGACNGSSVTKAYEYNTTSLAWVEIAIDEGVDSLTACASNDTTDAQNVNIGEAFWVFAKPGSSGLLTPIVP